LNYQLIADYDRRTFTLQTYEAKINASNEATAAYNGQSTNSLFFLRRGLRHCLLGDICFMAGYKLWMA